MDGKGWDSENQNTQNANLNTSFTFLKESSTHFSTPEHSFPKLSATLWPQVV
jgi:hypothetical protein